MGRRISKKKTGTRIRSLLVESGLNVSELQNKMELDSPQAIYKWLNGTNFPSLENLLELSRIFGLSMEEIIVIEEGENCD